MRPLAIFLTQLLLWCVLAQLNHAVAGSHLYFFLGGLFVVQAALTLPLSSGMTVCFLAGCVCDATAPASAFGTQALLFATAYAVLFSLRERLARQDTAGRVLFALLANLGMFVVISWLQIGQNPASDDACFRLFADLLASQALLALAAPWFFSLQTRSLALARAYGF